jgi:hypothetical protein
MGHKALPIGVLVIGQQKHLLAFAFVGQADRHHRRSGPKLGGRLLDGAEGDHLSGDLGEPLGSSLDGDEATVVDLDDIAGVVPAVCRRLDAAGGLATIVSEHDVGALHPKPPTFIDAGDRLQAVFDAGKQPPDRARPPMHRRIGGDDWACLGCAVAFDDP